MVHVEISNSRILGFQRAPCTSAVFGCAPQNLDSLCETHRDVANDATHQQRWGNHAPSHPTKRIRGALFTAQGQCRRRASLHATRVASMGTKESESVPASPTPRRIDLRARQRPQQPPRTQEKPLCARRSGWWGDRAPTRAATSATQGGGRRPPMAMPRKATDGGQGTLATLSIPACIPIIQPWGGIWHRGRGGPGQCLAHRCWWGFIKPAVAGPVIR